MDLNSLYHLKRLEEQIFQYTPNIKSSEKKKYVGDRLRNQLQAKAVVKIQRIDTECETLMISLKQRLMLLQDFLLPKKTNEVVVLKKKEEILEETDDFKLNLSSESSDDESLSTLPKRIDNIKTNETQCPDASESDGSCLPLGLRGKTGERRLSYKSYSSASTHSKTNRTQVHSKQENTVTTSGVVYHSEEILVEQEEVDTTPTLHIKIPSLHRGNVHYIVLDSLNFARKVFDYRANEVKQQQQQKTIANDTKISKQHKKQLKSTKRDAVQQQLVPEEKDLELSQFIQDVMTVSCNDETLQATNALENINKNLSDNYDFIENESFINYSQSSQEFLYSPNLSGGSKVRKKGRKNYKRSNIQQIQQNEPPKKRGRKPKKINDLDSAQIQPPTKSNLAQYVELFSNDCGLLPGSSTPAASSTRSQPLVSSTTHNFEVVDNISEMQEHDSSPQEPITYYIDGDWANGGPCQLVTTNRVPVDDNQFNQDNNETVQNFVNVIGNNGDLQNNIISTVLECNNNLPISNTQSLINFSVQNKNNHHQVAQQICHQSADQNSLLPIINIQLPPLPNNAGSSEPPPAHTHKEVVDLSVKSKTNDNNISTGPFNFTQQSSISLETYHFTEEEEECLPLDLSKKASATIDSHDEDFIRRLIEESDFNYRPEESSVYDNDNNKSLKSSLNMPLLEFDDTGLSSIENNLQFSDQSTEIFNKLMDICPDNQFLHDVSDEFLGNDDLNKSVFVQCQVENSTMLEVEKQTTQKNQRNGDVGKVYSKTFEYNQDIENTSSNEPSSSSSLAVQLDISDVNLCQINYLKLTQELNLNNEISNRAHISTIESEDANEVENLKTAATFDGSDTNTSDKMLNKASIQDVEYVIQSKVLKSPLASYKRYLDIVDKCLQYSASNPIKSLALNAETTESTLNTNDISDINEAMPTKENNIDTEISPENSQMRSKENVVFSVAKIIVTEDDNLDNTDNDFANENSNVLSELKTVNNDHNVKTGLFSCNLTTESASFDKIDEEPKGLIFCKNEVEKQQKSEPEKLVDVSENLNYAKVSTAVENTSFLHEKLSPLELESKLECPLDFDEYFDDTLSLATSFLDSPNDERFEDSIVDNNTTTTPIISHELQQNEMCPSSSQKKTLNHFKIPKLNNSVDSVIVLQKPEEMKVENFTLKNSMTKTQNIEKVTRTVRNDLVQINTDSSNVISERKYFENEATAEKIIIKVFGINCLPFLVDQCDGTTDCQLLHQLNDTEQLYRSLNSLDKIHANLAYQILYNHSKLFKMYFNIFCTYYTNRNDRTKLLNIAKDCERYPECAEFIISIYEGLVKCGLSRANACRLILKCIRETNVSTSIVEVLVTIIMKSDWTMFTDVIEKYTQDMYQFNFRICILEQMAPAVLNSKMPHLKQVFGKCVQTLHCDHTALLLNSPILIQCVSLLTTNT